MAGRSKGQKQCDICNEWYTTKGIGRHRAACLKKFKAEQRDAAFNASIEGILFVLSIKYSV
jgi:hypothetical protein